jgi:4-hydroxybenzoate polyprenyltransferase
MPQGAAQRARAHVQRKLSANAQCEALLFLLKNDPGLIFRLPSWVFARRFRSEIANRLGPDGFIELSIAKSISARSVVKALRPHHWSKNVLLFVPLLLSHQIFDFAKVEAAILGFLIFGVVASSIYVLNDVLDFRSDRHHPWKCKRPIAAGELSVISALVLFVALSSVGLGVAAFTMSISFASALLAYSLSSILYSTKFKRIAILDLFMLSSFYVLRIVAGGIVCGVTLSKWFLAFSLFFFFSMAMAKRFSELIQAGDLIRSGRSGRGYRADDSGLLTSMGVVSGFASVIILALFVESPDVSKLYASPSFLLALCPLLLYWICRLWLIAHRGELSNDPITFALRDKPSYVVAAIAFFLIMGATLV